MKWPLPDISWADSTVISFFWTISTSAKEGPLLIEILQKIQNKTSDTSNCDVMFARDNEKGGEIRDTKTLDFSRNMSTFVEWQVVSLMKNKQQNQNFFFKVDPHSTFRSNFLQPTTNVFVVQQVDHARWKMQNIDQKLATNNVAQQVGGICISYFAALTIHWSLAAPTDMRKSTKISVTGKDTIEGSHRKEKKTNKLIFSWLSWVAVLLMGTYYAQCQWWQQMSSKMVAMLKIIGWQRHAALV